MTKRILLISLLALLCAAAQTTTNPVTFTPAIVTPGVVSGTVGSGTSQVSCTVTSNALVPATAILMSCSYGPSKMTNNIALSPGISLTVNVGPYNGNELDFTITQSSTGGSTTVTGVAKVSGAVQGTPTTGTF